MASPLGYIGVYLNYMEFSGALLCYECQYAGKQRTNAV
jgi:hypothetical protein